jgi:hypothetical protein
MRAALENREQLSATTVKKQDNAREAQNKLFISSDGRFFLLKQ